MSLVRSLLVLVIVVCAAACTAERGDRDEQTDGADGAGSGGDPFGNAAKPAGSGSSPGAGVGALDASGTGGSDSAGTTADNGMAGAAGESGAAGSEPVIITSSCPTIATEIADGTAAPGFAPLFELEDIDIFGAVNQLELAPEHVYFLSDHEIMRVAKSGGSAELARSERATALLLVGDELVWSEEPETGRYRIAKAKLGSSDAATEVVAGMGAVPWLMISDGTSLFFLNGEPGIGKVALSGGAVETLAVETGADDLALLGQDLYLLNGGSLMQLPPDGSAATSVASLFFGGEIASDATSIYWADESERTIQRWSPGETQGTLLATGSDPFISSPEHITTGAGDVYWSEGDFCGQVYRVHSDGTGLQMLMEGFGEVSEIAIDDSGVYVGDENGLFRMDR